MADPNAQSLPKALAPALRLALAGKIDQADMLCRRIGRDPNSQAEAMAAVAAVCLSQRHEKPAMVLLERAIKVCPETTSANLTLANTYLERKEFTRAQVCLENLRKTHPGSKDIQLALAQTYSVQGFNREATEAFYAAHSIAHLPTEHVLQAARHAMQAAMFAEASEFLAALLSQVPGHAASWNDRGVALLQLGRIQEAEQCFARVIALDSEQIPARLNLATIYKQEGRLSEALVQLEFVRARMPNAPSVYASIGQVLALQGDFEEAIEVCQTGLQFDAESAELHHSLGYALRGARQHVEAMKHFDMAEAQQPQNLHLLLSKGNTALESGNLELANDTFRKLVQLAPKNGSHHRSLSSVHQYSEGDWHLSAMQKLAADETLGRADAIDLNFALGKAYDDVRNYERAFHHLQVGNQLKRSTLEYDETRTMELFDLMESMQVAAYEFEGSTSTASPIFIVGMPRSGTSLIEQILSCHPEVAGLGEIPDWRKAVGQGSESLRQIQTKPSPEWLSQVALKYLESVRRRAGTDQRTVDKMPSNFLYAGLMHMALPQAKIIHVQRHPLDTCLSCFQQNFSDSQAYAYDLSELGRYYRRYEQIMDHWRRTLPSTAMLEVRYEDVVESIEGQARRILEFCGLEWNEKCLEFHNSKAVVLTASAAQVRKPIYRSAVRRSDPYATFLAPLKETLAGIDSLQVALAG